MSAILRTSVALLACLQHASAIILPYVPPPTDVLQGEGVNPPVRALFAAPPQQGNALDRTGWTAVCDSFQPGYECQNAIDNDETTFWHTEFDPTNAPLPHVITIDMKATFYINGITYMPRQDGNPNGNIGQHNVWVSTDGTNFASPVAFGTWLDDQTTKVAAFETVPARYVRLQAVTEAGNRGPWTSAADILVYGAEIGSAVDRTNWAVTCDSAQDGYPCSNAIDGNDQSFWHTEYDPVTAQLPHTFTVDMGAQYTINVLRYEPRQDGSPNGNIGQYQIFVSNDGTNWGSAVASGTWVDDQTVKGAGFTTSNVRYVKLVALTEAGDRGPWTSAAEINVYTPGSYTPPPNGIGKWGPTIDFPLVPVAGTINPLTGNVVVWSSYSPSNYVDGTGQTVTGIYNPTSLVVTQRTITNTDHDMFCPGISMDFNGRTIVTGGNDAAKTSIYVPSSDSWIAANDMQIPRGYQAQATCSDGRTFVIGGSWSGGQGGKNGEIYNPSTGAWTLLPGCPVAPMLTNDAQGVYRADNHGWLFGWKNGYVFQAGPSTAMNWYSTAGNGGQSAAGSRAGDPDSMCGNAVMYDAVNGKILTLGGSPDYQGSPATGAAHLITLGNPGATPTVQTLNPMNYTRIFANAVVLPNGQVFVTGGQQIGAPFSDALSQLTPEMWDPSTGAFTSMASNSIPRNYHSISLLLLDGTVFNGGGGLCDTCSTNHFDAQIYTPQYLLNANGSPRTRPVINSVSTSSLRVGQSMTINANSAISSASMIRIGTATHTVDTDQRRIPLTMSATGTNRFSVTLPSDAGIALPGYWMLFVMNSAGTPSIAKVIKINP